jgi:hypothetical protein
MPETLTQVDTLVDTDIKTDREIVSSAPQQIAVSKHSERCKVCNHPRHISIDRDYLDWRGVGEIAEAYEIDTDCIYRHTRATGLKAKRQLNLRAYWERMMEMSTGRPKAGDGLKASELLAKSIRLLEPDNTNNVSVITVINYKDAKRDNTPIPVRAETIPTPTA